MYMCMHIYSLQVRYRQIHVCTVRVHVQECSHLSYFWRNTKRISNMHKTKNIKRTTTSVIEGRRIQHSLECSYPRDRTDEQILRCYLGTYPRVYRIVENELEIQQQLNNIQTLNNQSTNRNHKQLKCSQIFNKNSRSIDFFRKDCESKVECVKCKFKQPSKKRTGPSKNWKKS